MLENYLIECCSPTLASLKSGSLFNCRHDNPSEVEESVGKWNSEFEELGLRMCILRMTGHSALIYVYRTTSLARTLRDPEVSEFLSGYGYEVTSCCGECGHACDDGCNIGQCLEHLRSRVSYTDTHAGSGQSGLDEFGFPHEIGVFLGYPLDDVKGFIQHKGKNCKCTGIWKVYGDEGQAVRAFARFDKCRRVYRDMWQSGRRSIIQLTVAG